MVRTKLPLLAGIVVAGSLALFGGAQTWVTFLLQGAESIEEVPGHGINAALSPVAIAIVVSALALTIAGPIVRRVLGILIALLGGGVIAIASGAAVAPIVSVSTRVTELTGLAQGSAESELVWVQVSAWTWVTVGAGVLAALLGIAVTLVSGSWPVAGRKYAAAGDQDDAAPATERGSAPPNDRISDWDALSKGEDPSDYFR